MEHPKLSAKEMAGDPTMQRLRPSIVVGENGSISAPAEIFPQKPVAWRILLAG